MAAVVPTLIKLETEGDLQVLNLKFGAIVSGSTFSAANYFKNVVSLSVASDSALSVSESAGVLTFTSTSGAPTAFVRMAGN